MKHMKDSSSLSQSVEDYLEAMFCLEKERGIIKVKDISDKLQVKPPSVVEALQKLAVMGMVNYQPYRMIKLTPQGVRTAEGVIKKHQVLEEFLKIMGVEGTDKKEEACAMEHVLSNQTISHLHSFAEFIKIYPPAQEFIESFHNYLKQNNVPDSE